MTSQSAKSKRIWINLLGSILTFAGICAFPFLCRAEELKIERLADAIANLTLLLFAAAFAAMLLYLIRCMRVQPYSYKNAAMCGGLLFLLYILVFYLMPLTAINHRSTDLFMYKLLQELTASMRFFTYNLFPFWVLVLVGLFVSNLALIRHEGFSKVNMLGSLVALGLLLLTGVNVMLWQLFYTRQVLHGTHPFLEAIGKIIPIFFSGLLCYLECVFAGMSVCAVLAAKHRLKTDKDFMLILGCSIRKDGTLKPLLQGRVDRALEAAEEQRRMTGKPLVFVPSGGQGDDEVISEGEAMTRYLLSKGIPAEQILPETRSTSTKENMAFSRDLMEKVNPDGKVAFSTTNYHVFRSGVYAASAGLKAEGTGSKTKWYFWPNAFVREMIALLVDRKRSVAVNVMVMLLVSIGLGLLDFFLG